MIYAQDAITYYDKKNGFTVVTGTSAHDREVAKANEKKLLPVEKAVLFGEAGDQAVIDSRSTGLKKYYNNVLNFLVK